MREQVVPNIVLSLLLAAVPLVTEYATARPENIPGTGFDVLLYEPFDFAYVLLATTLFLAVNIYMAVDGGRGIGRAVAISVLALVVWFAVTFLAVSQLHLNLGGKL